MAKTVFGMPGVGDKTPGTAKTPEKKQDGSAGGGLPKNPGQGRQGGGAGTGSKPGAKKKGPAMAKPISAPMAKPEPAAKPAASSPEKKTGAKTMFGMPALKLPGEGDAPASPSPGPDSAFEATQAATGVQSPVAGGDPNQDIGDNATMLGVAPVPEDVARMTATTMPPDDIMGDESTLEQPAVSEDDLSIGGPAGAGDFAGGSAPLSEQGDQFGLSSAPPEGAKTGSKKNLMLIVAIAFGLTVLSLFLSWLLPTLMAPDVPEMVAPPAPQQGVPQAPPTPQMPPPTPPTPQSPSVPVPPTPGQ